jgi:anti-sigma-K factor RskA
MPPTPVDDHTDEFEQLAGLSALDLLEGDELARFERHAASCQRCRLMERLDREALARIAPEMDPSPDFKARLMQRAAQELAATAAQDRAATAPQEPTPTAARERRPEPIPRRPAPNVIPFWRRSRWVSALAAVLVIGLVSVGAFSYQNQVVATYSLSGSGPGSAVVVVRRSGAAELDMSGVPNPPAGFLYEAWVIPQGGQPVAAGTTTTGNATLPLPGDVRGKTVAITQERARVDAPTSAPLMATAVQS